MFVGRETYLARLEKDLQDVRRTGRGGFVMVRGRRRVGKSRLIEEFLRRQDTPSLYFAASRQSPERELELFARAVAESNLPASKLVASGTSLGSWEAAFNLLSASASTDGAPSPVVVVIDELPYLLEDEPALEGTLQKVWDRHLQDLPIMLIAIGSDVAMMRALNEYGRPLYGRPTTHLEVRPLTPPEIAAVLGLDGRAALEAYLVIGGSPFLARSWRHGDDLWEFLSSSLADPASPLVFDAERVLASEFPASAHARRILTAIGSGETTFTAIGRVAGLSATSLSRALGVLGGAKAIVAADRPLAGKGGGHKRYRIADPYLRFWLRFVEPRMSEIERERGDIVLGNVKSSWAGYCGRAVEPLVRDAIGRMLPDPRFGSGLHVGAYWSRTGDREVDVTVGIGGEAPTKVACVGSIKWRTRKPFDRRDRDDLVRAAAGVPGVGRHPRLIGVSASGFASAEVDVELGPSDLLAAWEPR